jgi:hypothetical protein
VTSGAYGIVAHNNIERTDSAIVLDASVTDCVLSGNQIGDGAVVNNGANYIDGYATTFAYGTEDLVAGESALETGKLYFVYE